MQQTRNLKEVHADMAGEHREIMALVSRIEAPCADAELAELLETLHRRLVDHFAHEQFPGGLYDCMGATDPRYEEELKVLVRDHCELLSRSSVLAERARSGAPRHGGGLREDVTGLVASLRDHELREHRLAETIERATA